MAEPEPWEDDEPSGPVRKFMYVNRRAPYGTIYALESLEVVLVAAAFEQDVTLVFMDDGVYQIKKDQNTEAKCHKVATDVFHRVRNDHWYAAEMQSGGVPVFIENAPYRFDRGCLIGEQFASTSVVIVGNSSQLIALFVGQSLNVFFLSKPIAFLAHFPVGSVSLHVHTQCGCSAVGTDQQVFIKRATQ